MVNKMNIFLLLLILLLFFYTMRTREGNQNQTYSVNDDIQNMILRLTTSRLINPGFASGNNKFYSSYPRVTRNNDNEK